MSKFQKDLEDIKQRRLQVEQYVKSAGNVTSHKESGPISDDKMSKKESKELKKLLKEKDKLERDALIARMKEKDQEKA